MIVRSRHHASGVALAAVLLLGLASSALAQSPALSQKASEAAELTSILQQNGFVRVIVMFDPPVAQSQIKPDAVSIANVKSQVASVQDAIIATHFASATSPAQGQGFNRGITRFPITPGFAVNVNQAELDALAADARVTGINYDRAVPPSLVQSVPLIGMTTAYGLGATGSGQVVAVLDTGVKSDHEFLAGKVVREACFSNAGGGGGQVSLCPNGLSSQTGAGAASPDGAACVNGGTNICNHGTHVAGIAAGQNTNQQGGEPTNGVARSGKIFAVQIFTRFNAAGSCAPSAAPCVLTFNSDQILGLDHVFANINLGGGNVVASANMSLGGGLVTGTCDGASQKPSIDNLRAAGVLTAIAAGNDGSTSQIGSPGCISTAVTVGSTTKSDVISSFSNMSTVVDVHAPGSSIQSSIPVVPSSNTSTYSFFNGTSMATPHVAGAIAAIRSLCSTASASAIESALISTGTPVADTRPGGTITKPRIRVDLAVQSLNCGAPPTPQVPGPLACSSYTPLGDFNGDNRKDILLRRDDGLLSLYFMNGTSIQSASIIGAVGGEFTLVGIADFNGDGRSDLLFRRGDGMLAVYLMNGAQVQAAQLLGVMGLEFRVIGTGDFNGDGRADILVRRTDGMLAIYLMNGLQIIGSQLFGLLGVEFTVAQIADFNGDGISDFLVRRADGLLVIYFVGGLQIQSVSVLGAVAPEVRLIGSGDFNGDGRADFLMRRSDGALIIYLTNGTQVQAAQNIGTLGTEFGLLGIGDLNADGRADLVFRRTDGAVAVYLLNGFQIVSSASIGLVGLENRSCFGEGLGGIVRVSGQ